MWDKRFELWFLKNLLKLTFFYYVWFGLIKGNCSMYLTLIMLIAVNLEIILLKWLTEFYARWIERKSWC